SKTVRQIAAGQPRTCGGRGCLRLHAGEVFRALLATALSDALGDFAYDWIERFGWRWRRHEKNSTDLSCAARRIYGVRSKPRTPFTSRRGAPEEKYTLAYCEFFGGLKACRNSSRAARPGRRRSTCCCSERPVTLPCASSCRRCIA